MRNNFRYISRHVVENGIDRGLAIVEIRDDGSVNVESFERETCFTRWTDGTIEIDRSTEPVTVKFTTIQKNHDISQ